MKRCYIAPVASSGVGIASLVGLPIRYHNHISAYPSIPETEQALGGLLVYFMLENDDSPNANTNQNIEVVSGIQGFAAYLTGDGDSTKRHLLGDFIDITGCDGKCLRDFRVSPNGKLEVILLCPLTMEKAEGMLETAESTGVATLELLFQFFAAYPAGKAWQKTNRYDPVFNLQVPKLVVEGWVAHWSSAREEVQEIPNVPAEVYRDYVEAVRAANIGAPRASVSMSRRALQSALKQKGAKTENLHDQIEELAASGHLTQATKSLAHGIRYFGNFGAHPANDILEDVRLEDAKLSLQVLRKVLKEMYGPARAK
jgi:hypothetical protein